MGKIKLDKFVTMFTEHVMHRFTSAPLYELKVESIGDCGGYQLKIIPRRMMWGGDVMTICFLGEIMNLEIEFHFDPGYIIVR